MVATQVNFEKLFRDSEKSYLFLLTDARGKRRGWGEESTGCSSIAVVSMVWSVEPQKLGASVRWSCGIWQGGLIFLSFTFVCPTPETD
jgi:hypothetical protein